MADIAFNIATQDIVIRGGDLAFTSDLSFTETMKQRIRGVLLTFLGEWFLDSDTDPEVGIPYFQSLFQNKLPTIELADTIFRQALINIQDVVAVDELSFDYDSSTRRLDVGFKVQITGGGDVVEDIIHFNPIVSDPENSSTTFGRRIRAALNRINKQSKEL